jgi:acetyl-CoA hydrolase
LVPDGAAVQLGIGGLASAVAAALHGHRNLRVHSGLIGDWVVGLAEAGVLAQDPGGPAVVAGTAVGTDRLYNFLRDNPTVEVRPVERVHDPAVTGRIPRFVAVNSALQVDLSGQVNAEVVGGRWRGAIGGQVDFLRGAAASPGGVGVVALPSTANGGSASRIVDRLDGPVTTGRADVHWVVTEHGAADLRGLDSVARAAAMCELAHPDHRSRLTAAGALPARS